MRFDRKKSRWLQSDKRQRDLIDACVVVQNVKIIMYHHLLAVNPVEANASSAHNDTKRCNLAPIWIAMSQKHVPLNNSDANKWMIVDCCFFRDAFRRCNPVHIMAIQALSGPSDHIPPITFHPNRFSIDCVSLFGFEVGHFVLMRFALHF